MFQFLNVCLILLCFTKNFDRIYGQDVSVIINTKRSLHIVDERFISIVIDPMILWTGLNISSQTVNLAKHFSPALIRIHGPSSSRLSFSDHDADSSADISQATVPDFSSGRLTVTPSMWASLNEWIISANLTPVYALNDRDRVNDAWNPKATALPLMELTDKMNITCYWELVNDTPNKTLKQYVDDVTSLRHILDAFPVSRNSWGTVGEDFNQCAMPENMDVTRKLVHNIETHVDAVNWSPKSLGTTHFPGKITKLSPFTTKYSPAVWTTAPRSPKPTSFKDGLLWAKYLGQAAVAGYDVIFRQPKIKELFEITPAYWVSLFHKSLMGRNVLDVRSSSFSMKDDCFVYAHCSKKQNRFSRRGAATIFAVNMEKDEVNISVKLLGTHFSNLEIQSYVLTAPSEDSSEIHLNGQILTMSDLQDRRNEFMPKIRRAKASTSVILTLPPKSVGFFVMPNAQLSTCIHGEDELYHIREEILEDQNENVWIDETVEIENGSDTMTSMNELYMMMEDLLESNEKYYKNPEILKHTKEWKKLLLERAKEAKIKYNKKNIPIEEKSTTTIPDGVRKMIIDRAKLVENQKKILEVGKRKLDLRHLLFDRSRQDKLKPKEEIVVPTDLELSSLEINRILADREKLKVDEKSENTETELSKKDEDIMKLNKKADELLNQFSTFQNLRGNLVSRRKRDLRNINQEENSANINDIENDKVSDIIVPENMCKCKKTGKCTCGLKLVSNLINKIWGIPKVLLNGDLNDITKSDGFENFLDFHGQAGSVLRDEREFDNKDLRDQNVQEIKKLLRQYHNEVKTIATSIRNADNKQTKETEEGNKETNQEPTVQVQRKKRSFSETLKEKHRQEKQKLRNRIKSRKTMFGSRIKERNGLPKHGQRFRRIRRETDDENENNENDIDQIFIGNDIVAQPNAVVDSAKQNLIPTIHVAGSTESGVSNITDSSTKSPIVGKPKQKQHSSKFKSLNRRLVQQKRLEERIATYLTRIRQTNRQLTQEIQRSVRSIREADKEISNENQENMIDGDPKYVTRIHVGADSDLINPLQNTIRNDETDNLLYDILKRQQDTFIDIRKREIVDDYMEDKELNKQYDKNTNENRTTKWNAKDEDQTKEEDIFFNEISKEDKKKKDNGYEKYMQKSKIFSSKYKDFIRKKVELRKNKLNGETNMEDMDNVDTIQPNYADAELLFNEIPKEDRFLPAKLRKEEFIYFTGPKILNSNNGDLEQNKIVKEDINRSEDEYGTKSELAESTEILNIQIPMNQNTDNNAYEIVSYPLFDSITILPKVAMNGHDFNTKLYTSPTSKQIQKYEINSQKSKQIDEKRESTSSEEIVIRFTDNKTLRPENKVHKDGFVDNMFETVFSFLNDFHTTIVNYLKHLAR